MLPMIGDEVASAATYGQIHEPLSRFCIELNKMKESERNISPSFKKTIDDLIILEVINTKYRLIWPISIQSLVMLLVRIPEMS